MKKYKVGDTIYIKDTVTDIDCDDSMVTYYGNHHGWLDNSCIIDELPSEPVKPVLPKAVGEELDSAKNKLPFDVYIGHVIDSENSDNASHHYYLDNTNVIIKLADAWRYGWTVENPKRYLIKVPHTDDSYFYKIDDEYCNAGDSYNLEAMTDKKWFTDAEIEHYGLQNCERVEVKE